MSNHVCTPETSRALVAAGFDMETTLVWVWLARYDIAGRSQQPELVLMTRDAFEHMDANSYIDDIGAPMATEIMATDAAIELFQNNNDEFMAVRQWDGPVPYRKAVHPNAAEAVAALVLEGRDG